MIVRGLICIVAAALLACAADVSNPSVGDDVVAEFAPTGVLRVAINLGNPVLAVLEASTGQPAGVSVDLARALAARLGVPLAMTTYASAGKVVEALRSQAWDAAFVAIDPDRAKDLDFSAPYLVIEGSYLVRRNSPMRQNADVDREGTRVVVGRGSAYDLFLSRTLMHAEIVRVATSPAVTDAMVADSLEVAAGVRQQLEADATRVSGLRLLPEPFMVINQAMALPKGRRHALAFLAAFVEDMKAGGFVAQALANHHVNGARIAPLAGPPAKQ